MDKGDATNEGPEREGALTLLNAALTREGFEAFYAPDKKCYLRHIATNTIATASPNPHRPFSAAELKKRAQLIAYLDKASEDELIEEVLLPLPSAWLPSHYSCRAQRQGAGIRQRRVDEIYPADPARPLLWHSG